MVAVAELFSFACIYKLLVFEKASLGGHYYVSEMHIHLFCLLHRGMTIIYIDSFKLFFCNIIEDRNDNKERMDKTENAVREVQELLAEGGVEERVKHPGFNILFFLLHLFTLYINKLVYYQLLLTYISMSIFS